MRHLPYLCAFALAVPLTACNKQSNVPAAPEPRRPKEKVDTGPGKVVKRDCEPTPSVAELPSAVPYGQRSIPESANLAASGQRLMRQANNPKTPPVEREDLITQAVKQFITALRADPYNVGATYDLAATYARIERFQCSLNLLERLVLLRKLKSQEPKVEAKIDKLLGRARYRGRLDPSFRTLRDNAKFRELVKQLDPNHT